MDVAKKEEILGIPRVKQFFFGNLRDISRSETYDLVVLWHSLEHSPDPASLLADVKSRLATGGQVLIQVPDIIRSPFDLAVWDHCSHFTEWQLSRLCASLGFSLVADGNKWIHNCLTLLLTENSRKTLVAQPPKNKSGDGASDKIFDWIGKAIQHFEKSTQRSSFVIFGTSIASLWVSSQLSKTATAFVDMDSNAIGNSLQGIPVWSPSELRPGLKVVMPFTNNSGRSISEKVKDHYAGCSGVDFILSPDF